MYDDGEEPCKESDNNKIYEHYLRCAFSYHHNLCPRARFIPHPHTPSMVSGILNGGVGVGVGVGCGVGV